MKGNEERIITGNSKDKSNRKQWRNFFRSSGKRSLSCFITAALCVLGIISPAILGIPGSVTALAEEADGTAMGRYMESEMALPEGCETFAIWDMQRLEDGRLRVAATNQEGAGLWDTADGGETWEKIPFPEEYSLRDYFCISLAEDGGGAAVSYEIVETEENYGVESRYLSFDAQGNCQDGNDLTGNSILRIYISPEGQVIGDGAYDLFYMDRTTGEILQTFSNIEKLELGFYNGELLVLNYSMQFQRYDIESGEPLGREEILGESLDGEVTDYVETMTTNTTGASIVFAEDAEGRFCYGNLSGIYSYRAGGSVVEQVVNGALNSLSNPANTKICMEVIDNVFYVAYFDGDETDGILKYEFDETVSSVPQREVVVYSLEENAGIRQAAIMFQKKYPDFYINYQVGMTGTDGVTVSDALRSLNTDILAGTGPDVLVMDGMSVDTYESQGILADLSGILTEAEGNDGLFENIAYTYQKEEAVPAVPARFGIPVAVGAADVLKNLNGLEDLVKLSEEAGNLDSTVVGRLLDNLYYVCSGSWQQEDRTLDQEKLTEYLRTAQQVYQNFTETADETALGELENIKQGWRSNQLSIFGGSYDGFLSPDTRRYYAGMSRVSLGVLAGMLDYVLPTAVRLETGDCEIEPLTGQQSQVYVPLCTLGVLNTSSDQEGAMELVSYLLSSEGELSNQYAGFSVNRKAFDAVLHERPCGEHFLNTGGRDPYTGEIVSLSCLWPTEEELTWLTETAESLTQPAQSNRVQEEVVKEEAERCMTGEISVEEAANSIMQKINLYLAE